MSKKLFSGNAKRRLKIIKKAKQKARKNTGCGGCRRKGKR